MVAPVARLVAVPGGWAVVWADGSPVSSSAGAGGPAVFASRFEAEALVARLALRAARLAALAARHGRSVSSAPPVQPSLF